MSNTNATALTRDQVEAQIRGWFAAGLPEGRLFFSASDHAWDYELVYLHVPDPATVAVWAVAFGERQIKTGNKAVLCRALPADLPGWEIEVWCDAPVVAPQQRIAVRGASS